MEACVLRVCAHRGFSVRIMCALYTKGLYTRARLCIICATVWQHPRVHTQHRMAPVTQMGTRTNFCRASPALDCLCCFYTMREKNAKCNTRSDTREFSGQTSVHSGIYDSQLGGNFFFSLLLLDIEVIILWNSVIHTIDRWDGRGSIEKKCLFLQLILKSKSFTHFLLFTN